MPSEDTRRVTPETEGIWQSGPGALQPAKFHHGGFLDRGFYHALPEREEDNQTGFKLVRGT
jgi:hypothetical protein